jgi:L-amino acid N-acyltransferase YncA
VTQASTLHVRIAMIDDLPRILEIYNAAIPSRCATVDLEPATVELKLEWFWQHQPDKRPLWVLECDSKVAGWAGLSSFYGRPAYDKTAELSIYITPENQRRGLAKYLLRSLIECCSSLRVETLLGIVLAHNVASIRLLEGLGFRRWGLLPGVAELDATRLDLLILGKSLRLENQSRSSQKSPTLSSLKKPGKKFARSP